jgi:N6-adenosine-specific RNA methylase IME4
MSEVLQPREADLAGSLFAELSPPYGTIVADPPWMYQKDPGARPAGLTPSMAEHRYSTMTNEEIAALPVAELAADQAHLYLWVTNPGMFGGRFSRITPRDIVEAWGFRYVTLLTWVKPGAGGMGWYFRGQTEHVVFATRGDLGIPSELRKPNVFTAPRSAHSVKPAAFLYLVEQVSPGPYVELFSRDPHLGWDSWGYGYELAGAS